ncbi:MAG: sugar transferase [Acidimicrobiales bacterium]
MTRTPSPHLSQLALDLVLITVGWTGTLIAAGITDEFKRSDARSIVMTMIAVMTTLVLMERRGLYAGRPALPRTEEISRVFVAVLAGASAIAVSAAFLNWHIGARELLIGSVGVFTARTLLRGLIRAVAAELPGFSHPERIVVVGTGDEARELVELITDHPESRFAVAGVVGNLSVAERSGLIEHWIGPTSRLIELIHQHEATGAIVTATGFRGEQFRAITRELFQSGYDVHLTTGISRLGAGRFDIRSLSHEPLVVMERNSVRRSHLWAKRLLDVVGASLILIVTSPLMALTALLIWLEDRGPIVYASARTGRSSEPFKMYKFRSMVVDAEALKASMAGNNERTGPLFKVSNDPRITRIGRIIRETSIDELPQLLNVVRGDMSLVGPRPALPEEEAQFDEELRDRSEVRPGITGLWQVEARSNAAFNAYRRLDLHYVENWTLWLDLRILLATAEQVIVTLTLLPLRVFRRGGDNDAIAAQSRPVASFQSPNDADVVIDLRHRSRVRLVAAESETMADLRTGRDR